MTREQIWALDYILSTIPSHGRHRPPRRALDRGVDVTGRHPDVLARAAGPPDYHAPVGGMNLPEYQQMLNDHYARQRVEAERKPATGDPIAGLRDATGFVGRADLTWLRSCN